jgi:hypothetical protein
MRISEDRYTRDLKRIQLAQRLIRHEVRTQSICDWAGITDDRVRNLYRSYNSTSLVTQRHRGPSPKRLATFLRSPRLHTEASAIAGLAYVLGVIPAKPIPDARRNLPNVEVGERMCLSFEIFQKVAPESTLTMDQVILLVTALASGEELMVVHCGNCHGALLVDRMGLKRRLCRSCKRTSGQDSDGVSGSCDRSGDGPENILTPIEPVGNPQRTLF